MKAKKTKLEKKVNISLIVKMTVINSAYLFVAFVVLFSTMQDFALAFIYSLVAQIISLIANGLFWVRWTFKNLGISTDAKLGLSTLVVLSLMSGIMFLAAIVKAVTFTAF